MGQNHFPYQDLPRDAPADVDVLELHEPFCIGDAIGIRSNTAEAGEREVLLPNQVYSVPSRLLLTGETWGQGDRLYWHSYQIVGGDLVQYVSTSPSHIPLGIAHEARTDDNSAFIAAAFPLKTELGGVEVVIDFAKTPELGVGAAGIDVQFIDWVSTRQVPADTAVVPGLVFEHDDLLTPGTATIALGDGSASNDQLLTATSISTILGAAVPEPHTPTAIPTTGGAVAVALTKLVMRVGVTDITAGILRIKVQPSSV